MRSVVGSVPHRVRPQCGQHLLVRRLLLDRPLSANALAALDHERGEERGLNGSDGQNDENRRPVPFPRARGSMENLGASRQTLLRQAPTLELPPVDHGRVFGDFAIRKPGTTRLAEHSHQQPTRVRTLRRELHRGAADDPVTDPISGDSVHRHRCGVRHARDHVSGVERLPAPVSPKGRQDHERLLRQLSQASQQRRVRPVLQHLELHATQQGRQIVNGLRRHGRIHLRGPGDDIDALRVGLESPGERERLREWQGDSPPRHVRRQRGEIDHRLERVAVHDRNAGKDLIEPLHGELQCHGALRDHGVDAKPSVLLGDVGSEIRPALSVSEPIEVEHLLVDLDPFRQLAPQHPLELARERNDARRLRVVTVQHQNPL